MCASYGLQLLPEDLEDFPTLNEKTLDSTVAEWFHENFGTVVRPTGINLRNLNPIVRGDRFELAWWGRIVDGAPAEFPSINSRLERVQERPGMANQRALIPATGWYEYQKPTKTRYAMASGIPFAFAGLTTSGRLADGSIYTCYSIITGPATPQLEVIHGRMPLVIPSEFFDEWLDPDAQGSRALVDATITAHESIADGFSARLAPTAKQATRPALF